MNKKIMIFLGVFLIIIVIIYFVSQKDMFRKKLEISPFKNLKKQSPIKKPILKNKSMPDISKGESSREGANSSPSNVVDSLIKKYGSFADHSTDEKKPVDNSRDFIYNKKQYTLKTQEDIKKDFNIDDMLPQEIEPDWFDVEPLMKPKDVNDANLLEPKDYIGINTVPNILKNGTHDIRGDISIPKISFIPWNMSTIDPDNTMKGLCGGN